MSVSSCSIYSEEMDRTSEAVLSADRSDDASSSDESAATSGSATPTASSPPGSNPGTPSGGAPSGPNAPTETDDTTEDRSGTDTPSIPVPTDEADAGDSGLNTETSAGTTTTEEASSGGGESSDDTSATVPPPVAPKPDYLIDDFEDTDPALPRIGKRSGYWFTDCSVDGTITPIEEVFVKPEDSGALYVAHVQANGFEDVGSWAAFGVNLNDGKAYADGAKYSGLKFYARAGGTLTKVRVEVRTIENDLPRGDGGVLLNDDTYGRVLEIGPEWQLHYVQWADSTFQQQGWGDAFDFQPEHMTSISFKLAPQETGFNLWLDDIEFIER